MWTMSAFIYILYRGERMNSGNCVCVYIFLAVQALICIMIPMSVHLIVDLDTIVFSFMFELFLTGLKSESHNLSILSFFSFIACTLDND